MGSLVEKGLLIALAIYFFFLIVHIVSQLIDILTGGMFEVHNFFLGG